MEIGISTIPASIAAVRDIAIAAERHGIPRLGIADSPRLFGAAYPAVQDALGATGALRIGPLVTNPLTMHSSVHAATLAALTELHPGRVTVAMGTGDSAVRAVGLPAAPREVLRRALGDLRDALGDRVSIEMAVSGWKAADAVPADVDGVVLGCGLSAPHARALRERAEAAAGKSLSARVTVVGHLVTGAAELPSAARAVQASVVAYARHGIGGDPALRDVPRELWAGLRAVFAGYRTDAHAKVGGENAELLAGYAEVAEYLIQRYALVGTAGHVAERLRTFHADSGVDGVSVSVNVPDPHTQIRLIGDELIPRLARHESGTTNLKKTETR